jgi:hypothetical protein
LSHDWPHHWPRFPRVEHLDCATFEDLFHLSLFLPVVLPQLLTPASLTPKGRAFITQNVRACPFFHQRSAAHVDCLKHLLDLFLHQAQFLSLYYSPEAVPEQVGKSANAFFESMQLVWGDDAAKLNTHSLLHSQDHYEFFGCARNYDVGVKENRHKSLMSVAAVSNKHDIESDIFLADDVRTTFKWLLQGGPARLGDPPAGSKLQSLVSSPSLSATFSSLRPKSSPANEVLLFLFVTSHTHTHIHTHTLSLSLSLSLARSHFSLYVFLVCAVSFSSSPPSFPRSPPLHLWASRLLGSCFIRFGGTPDLRILRTIRGCLPI